MFLVNMIIDIPVLISKKKIKFYVIFLRRDLILEIITKIYIERTKKKYLAFYYKV